jgi:hypothetical protein
MLLTLPGLLVPPSVFASRTAVPVEASRDTQPTIPWQQADKLLAADGAESAALGYSVAIDGDRIVAGAFGDAVKGTRAGAAYVYERNGAGDWVEVTKLLASDGQAEALFGYSVAISGDTIVVGAFGDTVNGTWTGAAYVFERNGAGVWVEVAKLLASDSAFEDRFGYAVVVGAYVNYV